MTTFTCSQLKGFVGTTFVLDVKHQQKSDEISGKRDFLAKISIKAASKFSATPLYPRDFPTPQSHADKTQKSSLSESQLEVKCLCSLLWAALLSIT